MWVRHVGGAGVAEDQCTAVHVIGNCFHPVRKACAVCNKPASYVVPLKLCPYVITAIKTGVWMDVKGGCESKMCGCF